MAWGHVRVQGELTQSGEIKQNDEVYNEI
jgi:hypothetical protein